MQCVARRGILQRGDRRGREPRDTIAVGALPLADVEKVKIRWGSAISGTLLRGLHQVAGVKGRLVVRLASPSWRIGPCDFLGCGSAWSGLISPYGSRCGI